MHTQLAPGSHPHDEAEKRLLALQGQPPAQQESEHLRVLHELHVYQVELEMQNEALSEAYAQVESLRAKYHELYDFAPVGYFTLSPAGDILELNLRAAKLLGQERDKLLNRKLQGFLAAGSVADLQELLSQAGQRAEEVASASLLLIRHRPIPLYVSAHAHAFVDSTSGATHIRLVLIDVSALKMATDDVVKAISRASDFGPL